MEVKLIIVFLRAACAFSHVAASCAYVPVSLASLYVLRIIFVREGYAILWTLIERSQTLQLIQTPNYWVCTYLHKKQQATAEAFFHC